MVALLVECSLSESHQEMGHSYDDIPCVELPGAAQPRTTPTSPPARSARPSPRSRRWSSSFDQGQRPARARAPRGGRVRTSAPLAAEGGGAARGRGPGAGGGGGAGAGTELGPRRLRVADAGGGQGLDRRARQPPRSPRSCWRAPRPSRPRRRPRPRRRRGAPRRPPPRRARSSCSRGRPPSRSGWATAGSAARPATASRSPAAPSWCSSGPAISRSRPACPRTPGEAVAEISVHLVRPAAQLAVTSDPEGAEVRLHGRTVGHTPATVT
jgi:hypothetical protein